MRDVAGWEPWLREPGFGPSRICLSVYRAGADAADAAGAAAHTARACGGCRRGCRWCEFLLLQGTARPGSRGSLEEDNNYQPEEHSRDLAALVVAESSVPGIYEMPNRGMDGNSVRFPFSGLLSAFSAFSAFSASSAVC